MKTLNTGQAFLLVRKGGGRGTPLLTEAGATSGLGPAKEDGSWCYEASYEEARSFVSREGGRALVLNIS